LKLRVHLRLRRDIPHEAQEGGLIFPADWNGVDLGLKTFPFLPIARKENVPGAPPPDIACLNNFVTLALSSGWIKSVTPRLRSSPSVYPVTTDV